MGKGASLGKGRRNNRQGRRVQHFTAAARQMIDTNFFIYTRRESALIYSAIIYFIGYAILKDHQILHGRVNGEMRGGGGASMSNVYFKGGQFVVEMLFGEDFNEMPPSMFFSTVPFHPNGNLAQLMLITPRQAKRHLIAALF